jgi:hypothetical protein
MRWPLGGIFELPTWFITGQKPNQFIDVLLEIASQ